MEHSNAIIPLLQLLPASPTQSAKRRLLNVHHSQKCQIELYLEKILGAKHVDGQGVKITITIMTGKPQADNIRLFFRESMTST